MQDTITIGRDKDERVHTELEIEDGRITIAAASDAPPLYVETPTETPLSKWETHATLRIDSPHLADGKGMHAEIDLDARALDALRDALSEEAGEEDATPAADGGRPQLHVGDHVRDRDDDDEDAATMVVVGRPVERADEYGVGGTVLADYDSNADYPDKDRVIEVVFAARSDVDIADAKRYAYPRSRLERTAAIHEEDDGGE